MKPVRKTKGIKRITSVFLVFVMLFSAFPFLTGTIDADAASKPAALKNLKAGKATQTSVLLTWTQVKSSSQLRNMSGIAVYRNGVWVKNVSKNTKSYRVNGCAPSTKYKFSIRAYRKTYKNQKQYYNKKTKKWQTKAPAKKWRGKTRTVKVKINTFGPLSSVYGKTKAVSAPTSPSKPTSGTPSPSTPTSPTSSSQPVLKPTGEPDPDPDEDRETRICVDFRGNKHTMVKNDGDSYWICDGSSVVTDSDMWIYDRTVDGSDANYIQISGATFNAKELANPKSYYYGGYMAQVYNVDPSKLDVRLGSGVSIESVNTYSWNADTQTRSQVVRNYILKNGKRIALAKDKEGKLFDVVNYAGGTHAIFCIFDDEMSSIGSGYGIYTAAITLNVYYDNRFIASVNIDNSNKANATTGMYPLRSKYYAVAKKAIDQAGGSTGTVSGDATIIRNYIKANITNGSAVTTEYGTISRFVCTSGAGVLETWLIYKYGSAGDGFLSGRASQGPDHYDYYLNSAPNTPLTTI